ncbi:MAG: LacI family transcriptional regulator [Verrucomicrobia bacterium]|nr:LacI family transcriptional regulator [Verrucomicrobiota bacterium]
MPKDNIVTIAILAKELGLGKATVSLALRDDPRIRKETRLRVQRLAAQRGYQANPVVAHVMSQLRSARVSDYRATLALANLGSQAEDLENNSTFRSIAKGFRARAANLGYAVDDFWIGDPVYRQPGKLKSVLHARKIDGVALLAIREKDRLPDPIREILPDCSAVGLGVRMVLPLIHCCSNNQYGTSLNAVRRLLESGKKRVGLVVAAEIDRLLNGKLSMGFRFGLEEAGETPETAMNRVWWFQPNDPTGFLRWHESLQPEVLLTTHDAIADWLKRGRTKSTALAHLDVDPSMNGWGGMNQRNEMVGAFGADLLTAHMARGEKGLPDSAKTMLVESEWVDGLSLRPDKFQA